MIPNEETNIVKLATEKEWESASFPTEDTRDHLEAVKPTTL
ncbi:hypothetical protein [Chryseobacterium sp.]